jgi:two-component system response regulator PilR (NtrC family)
MNILFIEDERDLQASGVMQLELKGHKVYPTSDLAESRALLSDQEMTIDLIISDHRLPDGLGVQFVIEIRELYPDCRCVIVSGCLTPKDIEELKAHQIPYYRKPLLYARVLDEMRKKPSAATPVRMSPEPEAEAEPEVPEKKKKRFGFWPRR